MRALAIAVILFIAAAPAYAQGPSFGPAPKDAKKEPTRLKQEDEAYNSSLKRIQPKDAASSDPWGAVRSDNTSVQNKPKTAPNTAR